MKKYLKKALVILLAGLLCFAGPAAYTAQADAVATQDIQGALVKLEAAQKLVDLDPAANGMSIALILGQAIGLLDPASPAVTFLRNAQKLAQENSSDAAAITALISAAKTMLSAQLEGSENGSTGDDTDEGNSDNDPDKPAGGPETTTEEPVTEPETTTQKPVTEPETTTTEPTTEPETTTEEPATEPETTTPEPTTEPETTTEEPTTEPETEPEEIIDRPVSGLPSFTQSIYDWAVMNNEISLLVPSDWGNNKSDSAVTNYSPANRSGAITPTSGTLQTSFYTFDSQDAQAFAEYEDGISKLNETSSFRVQDTHAAGLPGRRLQYIMTLGANQFECEIVSFAYQGTMYSVQILQGNKRTYDFYDIFDRSVGSLEIGIREPEHPEPEPAPEPEPTPTPQPQDGETALGSSLESFTYEINGRAHQFPTNMTELAAQDLPVDWSSMIPYANTPDGETGGIFNELINTSYFFFDGTLTSELAGVSNLKGYTIPLTEGKLTFLTDLSGGHVTVTLPGGVTVGSPESAVINAFPRFAEVSKDGIAKILGDEEFLYACNYRSDGTLGYVIIKNDAPYYSTLSIIIDGGVVREICFECIGSIRANGIFLY